MVKFNEDEMDSIFQALSDRTRRHILSRLCQDELSISDIASSYRMTLAAVSKHIRVLERAKLVRTTKEGRVYRCNMNFEPLEKASSQLEFYKQFWSRQLEGLEKYVHSIKDDKLKGRKNEKPKDN
jgi:DNA-binding transcriptional ArsR family regulator